jgi:hypothetical protein
VSFSLAKRALLLPSQNGYSSWWMTGCDRGHHVCCRESKDHQFSANQRRGAAYPGCTPMGNCSTTAPIPGLQGRLRNIHLLQERESSDCHVRERTGARSLRSDGRQTEGLPIPLSLPDDPVCFVPCSQIDIWLGTIGPHHPYRIRNLDNLAILFITQKQDQQALRSLTRSG